MEHKIRENELLVLIFDNIYRHNEKCLLRINKN